MAHDGDTPPTDPPRRRATDATRAVDLSRALLALTDLAQLSRDLSSTRETIDHARGSLTHALSRISHLQRGLDESRALLARVVDALQVPTDRP